MYIHNAAHCVSEMSAKEANKKSQEFSNFVQMAETRAPLSGAIYALRGFKYERNYYTI